MGSLHCAEPCPLLGPLGACDGINDGGQGEEGEVVVVKRKDVMCDTVAQISHVMDWCAVAVHIPYIYTN